MKRLIAISFLLWFPFIGFSQGVLDSNYTFTELNDMLEGARDTFRQKDQLGDEDIRRLADVYFLLAEYEESRFRHKRSFDNYTQSLRYYKRIQDTLQMFNIERQIADRYHKIELYSESLELYEELLAHYRGINDKYNEADVLFEMATVYKDKGDIDLEQIYLKKAALVNRSLKDTTLLLKFTMERVDNYERLNEIDSALIFAFRAFKLSNEVDNKEFLSSSLYKIGYLNKLRSDYTKAVKYLTEAKEVIPMQPYSENRLKIYRQLSDVYSRVNQYDSAFKYSTMGGSLSDSILIKDKRISLDNAAIKYQANENKIKLANTEQDKQQAERENKNQRRILYLMAAGLSLLLILMYFLIRFYTQKIRSENVVNNQKQEINTQKIRELEDNIKISSMQSMIEGQELERERIAKDLHDSLGGLLSTIKLQFDSVSSHNGISEIKEYRKANSLLDTAVEEVRAISHNLQPGALMNLGLVPAINDLINRFEGEHLPDIHFQPIKIPDDLNNMTVLSIYRIIQELFHNAIKHAKAKEILLQLNSEEDEMVIEFEDDGIGFDINNLKRKGMGLDNLKSRINYLKGNISIDSKEGEGTSYLMRFKYK